MINKRTQSTPGLSLWLISKGSVVCIIGSKINTWIKYKPGVHLTRRDVGEFSATWFHGITGASTHSLLLSDSELLKCLLKHLLKKKWDLGFWGSQTLRAEGKYCLLLFLITRYKTERKCMCAWVYRLYVCVCVCPPCTGGWMLWLRPPNNLLLQRMDCFISRWSHICACQPFCWCNSLQDGCLLSSPLPTPSLCHTLLASFICCSDSVNKIKCFQLFSPHKSGCLRVCFWQCSLFFSESAVCEMESMNFRAPLSFCLPLLSLPLSVFLSLFLLSLCVFFPERPHIYT